MILVDDRAGSRDLMRYAPLNEIGELCRLDSADVCFHGNGPQGGVLVGVEVKSVWDLLSSANTGRLQATQLPAMLREYDVSWLLYYGEYRPSPRDHGLQVMRKGKWTSFVLGKRAVPYGYLEALLIDITALGVRIKQVRDAREASAWLGVAFRWWSKPWTQHRGMRTFDNSREVSLMPGMSDDTLLRARVAAQLPAVGFERAVAAATHFGSVREMVTAEVREWEKVPGIGRVIAKAIVEAVK